MTEQTALADDQTLERRLDAAEIHLADQERQIADLNQMVTEQWAEIDRMKRLIESLTDQVREAEYRASQPRGPEPPPPHY